jgi:hypothetical protein
MHKYLILDEKSQIELQFTDRLSFYAGAGTFLIRMHVVQRDELGLAIVTPYVPIGFRYKMSKNWTVD